MLTIEHKYDLPNWEPIADFKMEDVLFFDIETTGFSPDVSSIYLIGCLFYRDDNFYLKQWFADDYISEESILHEFFHFLESYQVLVHYNGTGFDLPYITKKCKEHHLPYTFDHVVSFDLYKKISHLKTILSLTNLKQKTMEEFTGLHRHDPYNGGELIKVYSQYIQNHLMSKPCDDLKDMLLLHNAEDLSGLSYITRMLRYDRFLQGDFTILDASQEESCCIITVRPNASLPSPLTIHAPFYALTTQEDDEITIKISILSSTVKYFYTNYKDYFYLPKEDTAIHKSVASYVDKAYRQKAKASNCYTKKTGRFLPQETELFTPSFLTDYKETPFYFELTESFLTDFVKLKDYVISLLSRI